MFVVLYFLICFAYVGVMRKRKKNQDLVKFGRIFERPDL